MDDTEPSDVGSRCGLELEPRISGLPQALNLTRQLRVRLCLLVSPHLCLIHIASVPSVSLHPRRRKGRRPPQLERSLITRLVSRLANTHRPAQAAPSARVAHNLPLTGFVSGFHHRFRRTSTEYRTISVCFPFPFRIRCCSPFLDHHFHLRRPRAQRRAPHDRQYNTRVRFLLHFL